MRHLLGLILVLSALIVSGCFPPASIGPAPAATTPAPAPALEQAAPPATPSTSPTDAPTPTVTATLGATTYTSTALGISFSYLAEQNGIAIRVLEQGDKIYVHPATMEPAAGQWVQAFEKDADESLVDAVTRLFMPGHPAENCQVTEAGHPLGGVSPVATFEYAGIVVPRIEGEDMDAAMRRWQTCPQPYTVVGGIGYFQADSAHPDRFLFFSIGQYAILAGENLPWQETVRFE